MKIYMAMDLHPQHRTMHKPQQILTLMHRTHPILHENYTHVGKSCIQRKIMHKLHSIMHKTQIFMHIILHTNKIRHRTPLPIDLVTLCFLPVDPNHSIPPDIFKSSCCFLVLLLIALGGDVCQFCKFLEKFA